MPSSSASASAGELAGRAGQRGGRVRQGRRDGAQQPDYLGDPGGSTPGRSSASKTGPERLVDPVPRDRPDPDDLALPAHPGERGAAAGGGRRGRAPRRPGGCGRARRGTRRAPRRGGRRAGVDLGQPAGRPVKPGDVVAATGLLAGPPGPEPVGRGRRARARAFLSRVGVLRLAERATILPMATFAQRYRGPARARRSASPSADKRLPARMVTNSLHGRNINSLTGTAGWWERLPTFVRREMQEGVSR